MKLTKGERDVLTEIGQCGRNYFAWWAVLKTLIELEEKNLVTVEVRLTEKGERVLAGNVVGIEGGD